MAAIHNAFSVHDVCSFERDTDDTSLSFKRHLVDGATTAYDTRRVRCNQSSSTINDKHVATFAKNMVASATYSDEDDSSSLYSRTRH